MKIIKKVKKIIFNVLSRFLYALNIYYLVIFSILKYLKIKSFKLKKTNLNENVLII